MSHRLLEQWADAPARVGWQLTSGCRAAGGSWVDRRSKSFLFLICYSFFSRHHCTNQLVFYLFHIPASSSFNPLPLHKQASRCLSFLPCIAGRAQMLRRALTTRTNGGVQAKEEETNKKRKNIWSKKLLTCGPNKYFESCGTVSWLTWRPRNFFIAINYNFLNVGKKSWKC